MDFPQNSSHDHVLVNHLLLVDKMRRLLDLLHQLRDVVAPLVEHVVGLLALEEGHDALQPVDLGLDGALDDHGVEEVLALVLREGEQVGHPLQVDLGVVGGDDADVVLDDAVLEVDPALLAVLGRVEHVRGGRLLGALSESGLVDLAEPRGVDQLRRGELLQETLVDRQVLEDLLLQRSENKL